MARSKEREWVKANFNLDPNIKDRISDLAQFEGVSQSNFIELLVTRWDEGINPLSKLNTLSKERDLVKAKLNEVDNEIKKLTTQISAWDIGKREKAKKKPEAIRTLAGLIKNGNINEAERISKFWQTQTGFSSFELLIEANELVNKEKYHKKVLEV